MDRSRSAASLPRAALVPAAVRVSRPVAALVPVGCPTGWSADRESAQTRPMCRGSPKAAQRRLSESQPTPTTHRGVYGSACCAGDLVSQPTELVETAACTRSPRGPVAAGRHPARGRRRVVVPAARYAVPARWRVLMGGLVSTAATLAPTTTTGASAATAAAPRCADPRLPQGTSWRCAGT